MLSLTVDVITLSNMLEREKKKQKVHNRRKKKAKKREYLHW